MSRVTNIVCDAPKCTAVKQETNHWWILRKSVIAGAFLALPIEGSGYFDDDLHICGSPCLHSAMEAWIQSHTDQSSTVKQEDPNYG